MSCVCQLDDGTFRRASSSLQAEYRRACALEILRLPQENSIQKILLQIRGIGDNILQDTLRIEKAFDDFCSNEDSRVSEKKEEYHSEV